MSTLADEDDGDLDPAKGVGISLREAINHSPAGTTVTFRVTLSGGTIALGGSELAISQDLVIDASALGGSLSIDAGELSRVLAIAADTTVTLNSINLLRGKGLDGVVCDGECSEGQDGGGIHNMGALTLNDCSIRDCVAGAGADQNPDSIVSPPLTGGSGGGIYNTGALVLNRTTIAGCAAGNGGSTSTTYFVGAGIGGDGGGIYSLGAVTLDHTKIIGNRGGGGGFVADNGDGGARGGNGGGVYSNVSLVARDTTFSSNRAGDGGMAHRLVTAFPGDPGDEAGMEGRSTV